MTRIKLPSWMKEEVSQFIKQQMAMARMLAVRLIDAEPGDEPPAKGRVQAADIVRVVTQLDAMSESLDALVGGTPAFAKEQEDYQMEIAFAHYTERVIAYRKKQKSHK